MATMKDIARILVDAFDVDIQLYVGKSLKALRETPTGEEFANWAESNRLVFEVLLRGISVLVQRLPKENNSILYDAVLDQLERLPVEIRRATIDDSPVLSSSSKDQKLRDEEFSRKYEKALEELSEEELSQVARLSQAKLKEWVYSPVKIRPHLLKKWQEQSSAFENLDKNVANFLDGLFKDKKK